MCVYFIYTSLHLTQLLHNFGISSVAQNIHILKLDNTHMSQVPLTICCILLNKFLIHWKYYCCIQLNEALTKGVLQLVKRTFAQDAI